MKCFFCDVQPDTDPNVFLQSKSFVARLDDFPVSKGHTEIISRAHLPTLLDLDPSNHLELMQIIRDTKTILEEQYRPDGYNYGINEGVAAGQSVSHFHLHVIPRYRGDVEQPRGGVRNIIPGKGDYEALAREAGRSQYVT